MCVTCGCEAGTDHVHEHGHGHDHAHDAHHGRGAAPGERGFGVLLPAGGRTVSVEQDLLAKNDRYAAENRRRLARAGALALNLVSSPGSGKTTLLVRTLELLRGRRPAAVVEGDQQTRLDADRIAATGAPVVQLNTGKGCHLDAHQVGHALDELPLVAGGILFVENVGNLVCPAAFDLGEAHKVVVLSVTEGDDKPLKYPDMFRAADLCLLTKADLLPYVPFQVERAIANARQVNPRLECLVLSTLSGAGLESWLDWLERECTRVATAGGIGATGGVAAGAGGRCVSAAIERTAGAGVAGATVRQALRVRGLVQGVGFRPFVYRLATDLGLVGTVRNDGAGVLIDAQGAPEAIAALAARLRAEPPPLAQVNAVEIGPALAPSPALVRFEVEASAATRAATAIGPDVAVCEHCLAELFAPVDRRYRYAFTNCTDCGPRYTVTRALPYDRELTSLAPFPLCAECRREYAAPGDRRFHAEATACPACGPRLRLAGGTDFGPAPAAEDPIAAALRLLRAGAIVAIKGLGGFHLACDARDAAAVGRLRVRKQREEQPFAIMALNAASLEPLVAVLAPQRQLLESRERPIVLLERQHGAEHALPGIADGIATLGVMLPYTPIHYLLYHEASGRPDGTAWLGERHPLLLVMTSANVHGEPLVTDDAEALERLAGIADAWLLHDRAIVARCDDSVARVRHGRARFVRRARGFAPRPIRLARDAPSVLGVGGHYKVTACLTRADEAFVTPHVGDMDTAAARRALDAAVEHWLRLVAATPVAVAHDLHPDFHTTVLAARLAQAWDVPLVGVQHHHAHVAAVLAEQRVDAPALGLALDGVGYGVDGGVWGGELLLVDGARAERLGHLRTLAMPGGDRAAREPWRMAAAALHALGRGAEIPLRFAAQPAAATVARLLDRGHPLLHTSSAGRWFDAAAGLLGLAPVTSYEGQAAMLLEGYAAAAHGAAPPAGRHAIDADGTLDLLPLLAAIEGAADPISAAGRFHVSLALALADWVEDAAGRTGIRRVACGGGCFLNDVLARRLRVELAHRGLEMLEAEQLPPNDGALALGQCWVAIRTLAADAARGED